MSKNVLLILADAAEAKVARRSLASARDGPFEVEWVSRCRDATERLRRPGGKQIAAVVVDLFLPDSQGMATVEELFRARPHVPMLVLARSRDENVARLAVQRGAQDYLIEERLDGYTMPKALTGMLERTAHAEARILASERAQFTLNSIGDAVISTDVCGIVTFLNPVAESLTGWSQEEAIGRPVEQVLRIINGDSGEPAPNPLAQAILHNETVGLSADCVLVRRDGHESALEDTASPIHDGNGQVTGAVIVFRDVSAARTMSLKMSYLAQHDFLTELPNRMLLNDRLTQAMAAARRHQSPLAVLFVDIDHFKHINDSLGHAVGDQLLKSVARRLVASVRTSDTVSRQGGDEFVVLLTEMSCAADAGVSAAKILAALCAPHRIEQRDVLVTASIGIAVYPNDGIDAATLLQHADCALFHAKASGRGNHQFFEPQMRRSSAPELMKISDPSVAKDADRHATPDP